MIVTKKILNALLVLSFFAMAIEVIGVGSIANNYREVTVALLPFFIQNNGHNTPLYVNY